MSLSDDDVELYEEQPFEEEELPEDVDELMAVSFRNIAQEEDTTNRTEVLTYVHIFEGRDLHGRANSSCGDPIVRVTLVSPRNSQIKYTDKMKKENSPVWDRTLFLPARLSTTELSETRLLLEDVLIGSFEFSLTRIRAEPNRAFIGRWIALAAPSIGPGSQGFLRVSAAVILPGESLPIDEDLSSGNGSGSSANQLVDNIIRPPGMEVLPYRINIRLFKGRQFPKLDRFGTCDPYLLLSFSGSKVKSSVVNQSLHPVWNELVSLPALTPTMTDHVSLAFYNKNITGKKLIGNLNFSFSSIVAQPLKPQWYHIYSQKTNHYRGSVFLAISIDSCSMDDLQAGPTTNRIDAAPELNNTQWSALISVCEVAELPDKCSIAANFGGKTSKDLNLKPDSGFARPYHLMGELIQTMPIDNLQLPDIVVTVTKKAFRDSEHGSVRIKAADVIQEKYQDFDEWYPQWYSLFSNTGSLLLKVVIVPSDTVVLSNIPRQVPYPVQWYSMSLSVIRAESLLPMDRSGTSDPYVMIRCGPYSARTNIVEESLNPVWFQRFDTEIGLNIPPVPLPKLVFELMDYNNVGSDDDLGMAIVDIESLFANKADTYHWLPIKFDHTVDDSPEFGRLLVSIDMRPIETVEKPKRSISACDFKLVDKIIEIDAIGLRDLDIAKASYVQFRYPKIEKFLNVANQTNEKLGDSYWNVFVTSPTKTPTPFNPNILKNFNFPVKVPDIPEWCPSVEIRAYKVTQFKNIAGTKGKLLGTCSVSLTESNTASTTPMRTNDVVELDDEEEEVQKKDYLVYIEDFEALPETTTQVAMSMTRPPKLNQPSVSSNVIIGSQVYITTPPSKNDKSLPPVPESALSLKTETFGEGAGSILDGRKQLTTELEDSDYLNDTPFDYWDLRTGKAGKSLFGLMAPSFGKKGVFKGKIRLVSCKSELKNRNLEEVYKSREIKCRIFMMDCAKLVPKSSSGLSDPYPVIKLGNQELKIMDKLQQKTNDPEFYYCTDITTVIPGESELYLSVYDKNALFSDSLIGSTIFDLEFRSLSEEFNQLAQSMKLPVEKRVLWSPTSTVAQGSIRCWIELLSADSKDPLPLFEPPPCVEGELRLVMWKTKNVPFGRSDMIDLYSTARLSGSSRLLKKVGKDAMQRSDTHWRATSGNCNFNWRFVFPFSSRVGEASRLCLQLWDTRLVRPNDYMAEVNIDLRQLVSAAGSSKDSMFLDKQEIPMRHPLYEGNRGKVQVEVHLLTDREAEMKPAGKGRSEPNDFPHLPNPEREGWAPWRLDKYAKYYFRRFFKWAKIIGVVILALLLLRIIFWIF
ncbi:hypothetical protein GEMRC1_001753 [Eukaryota sp. GEM-RC1]